MQKAALRFVLAAVLSLVPVFVRQLSAQSGDYITAGTETRRGFLVDNVLHSSQFGGIHFSSYVPKEYDGSKPYALFITLPGWGGLYSCGGFNTPALCAVTTSIKADCNHLMRTTYLDALRRGMLIFRASV